MEFSAVAISLSLITLAFAFIFLRSKRSRLPPGTFGWPVIGESIEFLFGSQERFVSRRMKKYSPEIFKTKILGEKTVVICGPKGHKFLFSNEQKYFTSFRPHPMQRLFRSYQNTAAATPVPQADERSTLRQPGFLKPESLMRYLVKMDSVTQQQLQIHLSEQSLVKIYPMAKTLTLSLACHFFLGISEPGRVARLVKQFDEVTAGMHSIMINLPGTIFYRANRAAAMIRKELLTVIKEKKRDMARRDPTRDVLTHMIGFADPSGKSMAEDDIADKMMGLLTAGYSTVATTITFLMKYVGLHSEIYQEVREEQLAIASSKKPGDLLDWEDLSKMNYSWNVVLETLRLSPPLQGTFREALVEFNYGGYTIPKGWKVYWTVSSTNKNPDYYRDPETFNPARYEEDEAPPPYTFVPFGIGSRMCPGKEYARLAILVFFHNVVKSYKWEVVDPNEKVEGGMMPEPTKGLPVRIYHNEGGN